MAKGVTFYSAAGGEIGTVACDGHDWHWIPGTDEHPPAWLFERMRDGADGPDLEPVYPREPDRFLHALRNEQANSSRWDSSDVIEIPDERLAGAEEIPHFG